ncbi:MAG: DUF1641 domain-containing protein [Prolixibacteraceae bacterium]|jgi:uncharacterized protein YjgD (DUF1641 family)|nr:DUF1641 domain-containing protein [Prolixibacteraceae bacterium]MDD4754548.1 DUF1641 domain-containing protein [Prolixibacteraceae bacterium]NLO03334.1 DUF1641 domain-containing protein [Bacteroidales bacterium]
MEDKELKLQVTELNKKVDLLLDYVNQQRLKTNQLEDLISDVSIVGKDFYDTAVEELDNRMVDLDLDQVKSLALRILRNIENMNRFLEIFESLNDFLIDSAPILNEVIIDFSKKLDEFEKRGYFEFISESGQVVDKIVANYSREDIKGLTDNIINIIETFKIAASPEVLNSLNKGLNAFRSIDSENIPEYSLFKVIREINSPEMKKAMGFMMTLLKAMTTETNNNKNK